jgi:predicted small secreted protein
MKHKALLILLFLLAVALLLNGCGGTEGGGKPNPTTATVTGTITDGRSGPGISGATVEVYVSGAFNGTSAMTGADGRFSVTIPANGAVDLIASKSGYASTRYQRVNLLKSNSYIANMIMKKVFNSSWSTAPPVATINATPGQTVSREVTVYVSLTGGQDSRNGSVALAVGKEDFWYDPTPEKYPFEFDLDSASMPNGPNFYYIMAYDLNNNCVINWIPVTIRNNVTTGPALTMNQAIYVVAYTLGEDMQFSQPGQINVSEAGGAIKNWDSWRSSVHTESAEINSACFVYLYWAPEFEAPQFGGYKIYRASGAGGPWTSIGYAAYDYKKGNFYTYDVSPEITPNVPSYYKVLPVNADGVEGQGKTGSVTPLSRYEVNLVSPENNATGVSLNPVFTWSKNLSDVSCYTYRFRIESLSTEDYATYELSATDSQSSVTYSQPVWNSYFALKNNQKYQWDITEAEAIKNYNANSRAISISRKGENTGSHNGGFVFTTAAN